MKISHSEEEIKGLSKIKWDWMAEKEKMQH